jgi:hypothetical protein
MTVSTSTELFQMTEGPRKMNEWLASTDIRKQVVVQSLKSRVSDLRHAAGQCRKAYTKDYMNIPMNWLADAYDEAAAVLDAKLAEASSVSRPNGEATEPNAK